MVTASIHPRLSGYSASVRKEENTAVLTFSSGSIAGGQIVIFGNSDDADALAIIADIFNDRFKQKEKRA